MNTRASKAIFPNVGKSAAAILRPRTRPLLRGLGCVLVMALLWLSWVMAPSTSGKIVFLAAVTLSGLGIISMWPARRRSPPKPGDNQANGLVGPIGSPVETRNSPLAPIGERAEFPLISVTGTGRVLHASRSARLLMDNDFSGVSEVFETIDDTSVFFPLVKGKDGPLLPVILPGSESSGRRDIMLLPAQELADPRNDVSFDTLPVPLLKLSVDGQVLNANRAADKLAGRSIVPGSRLSDLVEGLGRSIGDWLAEAALATEKARAEFLRLRRDDREMFVQVTLGRVVESGNVGLVAVLNDATELKSLEAQFVQSQKMQAIGQLAGGVAHDFNNLLTAITGHCDLLLLRHDQGDPDFTDLVQINQNANRAAALVNQLLAFSRKQTLRPENIDLRNTLSDLTHLLNRLVGEKVALMLEHDPVLPTIRADKRQLEQVLMNLVVNARDAMPEGERITIETENLTLNDPLSRDRALVPAGQYVRVTVRDEGVGIAPERIQKVFEPFHTTKRTGEGTGLGLSTAYGIVKQTGGYIFVDSTVGVGTAFQLIFPVHTHVQEPEAPAKPPPVDVHVSRGNGLVLLVEDEAPVRSFAVRALRLRGYTVIEADSGERALEILEDDELAIDLFVSDVVMPGLDGPGWVAKARETRPGVRVVFMSGYAEDSFADKQAGIPNSQFLPKPFSLAELIHSVQTEIGVGSGDRVVE